MEEKCLRWLERHLLTKMTDDSLHTLSLDLLKRLIESPTLFVVHIELDVYLLCRKVCAVFRLIYVLRYLPAAYVASFCNVE